MACRFDMRGVPMNRFCFLEKIQKAVLIILFCRSLFRMEFNLQLLQYGTIWFTVSIRTLILPILQELIISL
jgi:hypothetical protein